MPQAFEESDGSHYSDLSVRENNDGDSPKAAVDFDTKLKNILGRAMSMQESIVGRLTEAKA